MQAIIRHTRERPEYESGLSPRAALSLLRAAQAWALLHHREAVLPEDVQSVLPALVGHRLRSRHAADYEEADRIGEELLAAVPVP